MYTATMLCTVMVQPYTQQVAVVRAEHVVCDDSSESSHEVGLSSLAQRGNTLSGQRAHTFRNTLLLSLLIVACVFTSSFIQFIRPKTLQLELFELIKVIKVSY
jgi:hypothetical protein